MSYHGYTVYDPEEEFFVPTRVNSEYFVSETGHVLHKERLLHPKCGDKEGHLSVCIRNENTGKREYHYVHRLVMDAFNHRADFENLIVRHLDDDPTNNNIENLAYGTQKDNHMDAVRNGKSYMFTDEDRKIGIEKCSIPVTATNIHTGETIDFRSGSMAANKLGLPQHNVWSCLNGKRHRVGDYRFQYKGGEKYD